MADPQSLAFIESSLTRISARCRERLQVPVLVLLAPLEGDPSAIDVMVLRDLEPEILQGLLVRTLGALREKKAPS